jgi:hypothetical protein
MIEKPQGGNPFPPKIKVHVGKGLPTYVQVEPAGCGIS